MGRMETGSGTQVLQWVEQRQDKGTQMCVNRGRIQDTYQWVDGAWIRHTDITMGRMKKGSGTKI